nr:LuxR C-terminal-related transcriptional regulator [Actinopolyspora biskrensis]
MLATSKRVAHQCGNSFWSSRADQALNGPNHASTSAKLTPQEKRVARLAKTGMSNNEIADQMYITVGAVEQHLSKVFKKRNISNRRDLSYAVICCD